MREGKASVNVEVGVAGWGEKVGGGGSGLKKGGKDRLVVERRCGCGGNRRWVRRKG